MINIMKEGFFENTKEIHYSYDASVDASYISLTQVRDGEVNATYPCDNLPASVSGQIFLDFDKSGRLLGIEVLGGKDILPDGYTQG